MRTSLLIALVLFALPLTLTAGRAGADDTAPSIEARAEQLSMTLSYTSRERSMDSNSQSWTLRIDGRDVTYSGPIGEGERGRFASVEDLSFRLDDEALTDLVERLERNGLLADFEEHGAEAGAPSTSVRARVTIEDQGQTHTLDIQGTVGGRSGTVTLSEDARDRAGALDSLCWALKRIADEAHAGDDD